MESPQSAPSRLSQRSHLITVTFDYWPLAQNDGLFLRARYENGYERAAPDEEEPPPALGRLALLGATLSGRLPRASARGAGRSSAIATTRWHGDSCGCRRARPIPSWT